MRQRRHLRPLPLPSQWWHLPLYRPVPLCRRRQQQGAGRATAAAPPPPPPTPPPPPPAPPHPRTSGGTGGGRVRRRGSGHTRGDGAAVSPSGRNTRGDGSGDGRSVAHPHQSQIGDIASTSPASTRARRSIGGTSGRAAGGRRSCRRRLHLPPPPPPRLCTRASLVRAPLITPQWRRFLAMFPLAPPAATFKLLCPRWRRASGCSCLPSPARCTLRAMLRVHTAPLKDSVCLSPRRPHPQGGLGV